MIFFFIFLLIATSCPGILSDKHTDECMREDNCESCLSTYFDCAWCTDPNYENRHRCATHSDLLSFGCSNATIIKNEQVMKYIQNDALGDYRDDNAFQVQPQKIYLKLVKSVTQQIKISYRPAVDYPLDLYVLMDLTWTMRDDKETLVKLGTELTESLRELTANYKLGFGSFADKPIMPMIMPHLKENPCAPEHAKCVPTYSFKHMLSLTENITAFINKVNSSEVTGNLDNLEGGLEALMQVAVCEKEIGWKKNARKVIILVTDGFFHLSGDGLLAGVVRRQDKKCHLNEHGDYTASLEFDYPSLYDIYAELSKRKISVIFAVTSEVVKTYRKASSLMKEISNVETLTEDSSNIIELINKSYRDFVKRVQFRDNSPKNIKIEYFTKCGIDSNKLENRNYCNEVEVGNTIDFLVNVTLLDFPDDGNFTHKIRIDDPTLNEHVEIDIEIQKPCPCVDPEPKKAEARGQCFENGYLSCGMCVCDEGWIGTYCSCPIDIVNNTVDSFVEKLCRPSIGIPPKLGAICSDNGECDCGVCICSAGYSGKYCECPDCASDCDLEKADCFCGRCVCKYGYSGNSCNCKESDTQCIGPSKDICSGRGTCECGSCVCEKNYFGDFCEIGGNQKKLCGYFEPCVTCLIQQKLGMEPCANISDICKDPETNNRFMFDFSEEPIDSDDLCFVRLTDKNGLKCDHYFDYHKTNNMENYLVINISSCQPVDKAMVFWLAILATVLIGLAIIFAVMAYIKASDARDYAQFEKEQRNSLLSAMESPLYKNPVIQYKVPQEAADTVDSLFTKR